MPYTDSASAEATLSLVGAWIHDPDDPSGTIAAFPYGKAQRSTEYDSMGSGAYYSGRALPVFDFGEHESEAVSVTIDVPHGTSYRSDLDTLREFAASKKPLWFRDNRGRAAYGVMVGFSVNDEPWGARVGFSVEHSDREIETVAS